MAGVLVSRLDSMISSGLTGTSNQDWIQYLTEDLIIIRSGLVGVSVSRLDTMISSGLTGIDIIRSGLAGVSVSRLDIITNLGLVGASNQDWMQYLTGGVLAW